MFSIFIDILKTARPRQWVKNLTLYAGLVFAGYVFPMQLWIKDFWVVTEAVFAFTLVASSIYFFNDLMDVEADKAHPFKRLRPIASGSLPKHLAIAASILLVGFGLIWSFKLSIYFFMANLSYWLLQALYSVWLKHIEVVDVFVIALGFFIRVFAGALVIDAHLSIWFLLCVICVSLFLAVGKRRGELAILTARGAIAHRKVMEKYSTSILDSYVSIFATAAFFSWALFSFNFYDQVGPVATKLIPGVNLSRALTINKWLMATIPVVIFGIMRYIRIIYDGSRAETPERVILSDIPLLGSVAVWGMMVVSVLYILA